MAPSLRPRPPGQASSIFQLGMECMLSSDRHTILEDKSLDRRILLDSTMSRIQLPGSLLLRTCLGLGSSVQPDILDRWLGLEYPSRCLAHISFA